MLSFIALLLELKNNNVKEESKKSDAFIRARVSSTDWNIFKAEKRLSESPFKTIPMANFHF